MGGTCSAYGTKKSFVRGFCCGDLGERDNLEEQRVDEKIILKCIFNK